MLASTTSTCTYDALNGFCVPVPNCGWLRFLTRLFYNRKPITFRYQTPSTLKITGHILDRITVSCSRRTPESPVPTNIHLFVTLRKLNAEGKEVFYTGTIEDPVPVIKG